MSDARTVDGTSKSLPMIACTGAACKGKNAAKSLHSCPYAEDVNDDPTPCCTCCDECATECARDV